MSSANTGISKKLSAIVTAMRPKQWVKNVIVFAGLVFSKSFLDISLVAKAFFTFCLFSVVSGVVYIINDIVDREKDKLHPEKCKRPIASGRIKPGEALIYSILMLIAALTLAFLLDVRLLAILAAYFILVCLYSLVLKNIIIVDVIAISVGFVLRTLGGTVVIDVMISPWLILCTTLLSLFLALNKRKNELTVLSGDAANYRKILDKYTPQLIDNMLGVVTSTTVMSYSLYTFEAGRSSHMMITIPFVLYGIFRYQYLVSSKNFGGSPELVLFKDKPLLIDILLWGITCLVIVGLYY